MLRYKLNFNSCAIRDNFCKSSHIYNKTSLKDWADCSEWRNVCRSPSYPTYDNRILYILLEILMAVYPSIL